MLLWGTMELPGDTHINHTVPLLPVLENSQDALSPSMAWVEKEERNVQCSLDRRSSAALNYKDGDQLSNFIAIFNLIHRKAAFHKPVPLKWNNVTQTSNLYADKINMVSVLFSLHSLTNTSAKPRNPNNEIKKNYIITVALTIVLTITAFPMDSLSCSFCETMKDLPNLMMVLCSIKGCIRSCLSTIFKKTIWMPICNPFYYQWE